MLTDWSEIKISGKESYPEQGLLPDYSGTKWVSSRILFVHSGSKAAANNDLSTFGCCIVATTRTTLELLP